MISNKKYNILVAVLFIVSLALRLGLALYNREANDPHMPVVRYIMRHDNLPEKMDCTECFQPKLFHYAVANVLTFLRLDTNQDSDAQKVVAQLINFLAGACILAVAWVFIAKLSGLQTEAKILGFALLAFNPQLIGINSQVTNDTFLILFSSLAVLCAYFTLVKGDLISFLLTVMFSALAVITKTNGWVAVIAVTLALFVKWYGLVKGNFTKQLFFAIAYPLLVVSFVVLNPLSQYMQNIQRYGSPVTLNIDPLPHPMLLEESYIPYAGILSVQDGFLTFKFENLLKEPVTYLLDEVSVASHRTSFWTRLYGSANSVHFENYPPSWRMAGEGLFWIYRGIFILALLPLTVMLVGAALEIRSLIKGVWSRDSQILSEVSYGLFALLFAGYIAFALLYAFEYRVYTVMKAAFMYPGLLAFLIFFIKGLTEISSRWNVQKWQMRVVGIVMTTLVVFYILDVVTLVVHLLPNRSGYYLIMERLMHAWQ